MKRFLVPTGVLTALVVLGSVSPAPSTRAAEDPAKPKNKTAAKSGEAPAVITNEVLERMFGKVEEKKDEAPAQAGSAVPAAAKADAKADPLKAMEEEQQRAAERQGKIAEAEKKLSDAEALVRDLEKRRLAARNPLLPRPEISEEEQNAQAGMDQAQRAQRTEQQLAEAREQLERARADLAKARSGS